MAVQWETEPVGHIRLSDRIYEDILRRIVSGHLPTGSRLPPENDLCRMFAVSRPIVRQALSRLRDEGLLESRKGSGSFIASQGAGGNDDLATRGRIDEWVKLFEFRMTFEPTAAELAARVGTDEQIRHIRHAVDAFKDMTERGEVGHFRDSSLHIAVAEATDNPFFGRALGVVRLEIDLSAYLARHLTRRPMDYNRLPAVYAEHEAIVQAVEQRDPEGARRAMAHHMEKAREFMLESAEWV